MVVAEVAEVAVTRTAGDSGMAGGGEVWWQMHRR